MRAMAERQMFLRIGAGDVETVRFGKLGRVSIGRSIVHDHFVALGDGLAAKVRLRCCCAAHISDGTDHADRFMDEIGKQILVRDQLFLLVGEFGQKAHCARQRVAGRVIASKDDQEPGTIKEFGAQWLAVNLDIGDRGQKIVLRIGTALGQHMSTVIEHGLNL